MADKALVFTLGGARFAVDIGLVETISALPVVTFVPGMPPQVKGAGVIRGEIVPFIDLRALWGLEASESRCAVLIRAGELRAALIVDNVAETVDTSSALRGAALLPGGAAERYLPDGTVILSADALCAAIFRGVTHLPDVTKIFAPTPACRDISR